MAKQNKNEYFKTFITGKSNILAYRASLELSTNSDTIYNPLFIYGKTGLGKTHLLKAIEHSVIKDNKKVLYITAEQFANDFTLHIKNSSMEEFRRKYRNLDLFLIDDIQFISGREQTQEELIHIFNELTHNKKQVVITSSQNPFQIVGFHNELKSRFSQGLVSKIKKPSHKTKISIIKHKCKFHKLDLTKNIIQYIAKNSPNSVTSLVGHLVKIKAHSTLLHQEINFNLVRDILEENNIPSKKDTIDNDTMTNGFFSSNQLLKIEFNKEVYDGR